LLLVLLCACERYPESYPPPEQRRPVERPADSAGMMVNMSDADAASHFVKDIAAPPPGAPWRWTGQQPTLKILAYTTENLKLLADFTLWPVAFQQTGPVELTFVVNRRALDKVRYTTPGYKHFEKAIPSDYLATDVESTVSVAIDKMYVHPEDKQKYGFILTRIGFVP
jgi:hypothetical protein